MAAELDLDDMAAQSAKAKRELEELRDLLAATADALDYLAGMTTQQAAALRKDAERYRFEREHRFQWFEPTRHWRLTTATGKTVHEGAADTYDEAVDAAMAAGGSVGAA